jgi:hypothetical protein
MDLEASGGLWITHSKINVFLRINDLLITAKYFDDDCLL